MMRKRTGLKRPREEEDALSESASSELVSTESASSESGSSESGSSESASESAQVFQTQLPSTPSQTPKRERAGSLSSNSTWSIESNASASSKEKKEKEIKPIEKRVKFPQSSSKKLFKSRTRNNNRKSSASNSSSSESNSSESRSIESSSGNESSSADNNNDITSNSKRLPKRKKRGSGSSSSSSSSSSGSTSSDDVNKPPFVKRSKEIEQKGGSEDASRESHAAEKVDKVIPKMTRVGTNDNKIDRVMSRQKDVKDHAVIEEDDSASSYSNSSISSSDFSSDSSSGKRSSIVKKVPKAASDKDSERKKRGKANKTGQSNRSAEQVDISTMTDAEAREQKFKGVVEVAPVLNNRIHVTRERFLLTFDTKTRAESRSHNRPKKLVKAYVNSYEVAKNVAENYGRFKYHGVRLAKQEGRQGSNCSQKYEAFVLFEGELVVVGSDYDNPLAAAMAADARAIRSTYRDSLINFPKESRRVVDEEQAVNAKISTLFASVSESVSEIPLILRSGAMQVKKSSAYHRATISSYANKDVNLVSGSTSTMHHLTRLKRIGRGLLTQRRSAEAGKVGRCLAKLWPAIMQNADVEAIEVMANCLMQELKSLSGEDKSLLLKQIYTDISAALAHFPRVWSQNFDKKTPKTHRYQKRVFAKVCALLSAREMFLLRYIRSLFNANRKLSKSKVRHVADVVTYLQGIIDEETFANSRRLPLELTNNDAVARALSRWRVAVFELLGCAILARSNLEDAQSKTGLLQDAQAAFRKALRLDPSNVSVLEHLVDAGVRQTGLTQFQKERSQSQTQSQRQSQSQSQSQLGFKARADSWDDSSEDDSDDGVTTGTADLSKNADAQEDTFAIVEAFCSAHPRCSQGFEQFTRMLEAQLEKQSGKEESVYSENTNLDLIQARNSQLAHDPFSIEAFHHIDDLVDRFTLSMQECVHHCQRLADAIESLTFDQCPSLDVLIHFAKQEGASSNKENEDRFAVAICLWNELEVKHEDVLVATLNAHQRPWWAERFFGAALPLEQQPQQVQDHLLARPMLLVRERLKLNSR